MDSLKVTSDVPATASSVAPMSWTWDGVRITDDAIPVGTWIDKDGVERPDMKNLVALVYSHGALIAAAPALLEALRGVASTSRPNCWCDQSNDVRAYGHQPKCIAAGAALSLVEGK